jgi:hypothetical protein
MRAGGFGSCAETGARRHIRYVRYVGYLRYVRLEERADERHLLIMWAIARRFLVSDVPDVPDVPVTVFV